MKNLFLMKFSVFICAFSFVMLPVNSIASDVGNRNAAIAAAATLGALMIVAPRHNDYYYEEDYGPAPAYYYGPADYTPYEECTWVRGYRDRNGYWVRSHQECW